MLMTPLAAEASAPARPRPPTRGARLWLLALAGLLLGAVLVWAAVLQRPDGRLHLYVLDVGQGDALLLTSPQGHVILVDGGPDPSAVETQLGRHLPFWRRNIDLLVLTHPHEDHLAGLVDVLARYDVGQVIETPYTVTTTTEAAWTSGLAAHHVPVTPAVRGLTVEVEPGLALRVLGPGPDLLRGTHSDINNSSAVLRLTYGQISMLLTGDIETEAVARLLASANTALPLTATVLKVPHHGSATGLSAPLLAAIRPQVAVISVGAANPYGHPAPDTLTELADAHVPVYRTDLNGTLDVSSDGTHLWVVTEK